MAEVITLAKQPHRQSLYSVEEKITFYMANKDKLSLRDICTHLKTGNIQLGNIIKEYKLPKKQKVPNTKKIIKTSNYFTWEWAEKLDPLQVAKN